ncbi:MAG: DNA primase [Myxococcales bacterium]
MAAISDDKLQELRDRVDVVQVVGRRVQLKKSGRDFKGLCPFHGEKTPSFYVVPDKHIFHCFGCGATGDAIRFLMQAEGRSFRDAVEELARDAGVALETEDPEEQRRASRRAALAEVNEKACRFFERVLWEHAKGTIGREHLRDRGISEETAKAFRLGYAPALWDALAKSLARQKVDARLVEEAGLAIPRKERAGLYDRFRGRLTIPIREAGRIVGFGGRLLEGESEAKYLNSPDTPLYAKGGVLFALDKARDSIRADGIALFVEGYFDAIGLHQAGIASAVATCGTALTDRHLDLVQRAGAREVVFVFDGDAAGLRAAQRASEVAAAKAVPARVLMPPDGEDPDQTVLRIGAKRFRELVVAAQPALEFLLDRALAQVGETAPVEARVRTVDAVASIVRAAPDRLARDLYLDKVAQRIGASGETVRQAIFGRKSGRPAPDRASEPPPARSPVRREDPLVARAEHQILAFMLQGAEFCAAVEKSGALAWFSSVDRRQFAESLLAKHQPLDPEPALAAFDDDRERAAVLHEVCEMRSGGVRLPFVEDTLTKYCRKAAERIAKESAARRKVARALRV